MGIRMHWAALGLAAVAAWGSGPAAAPPTRGPAHEITVFKSPTCGCCRKWVEHLRTAGFRVIAHDTTDLEAVMTRYGVPSALASCHTAVVEGYVIEGHVPADLIARLLTERPKVVGLAVPGMPANAPGMDMPSTARYQVLTFDHAGKTALYAVR